MNNETSAEAYLRAHIDSLQDMFDRQRTVIFDLNTTIAGYKGLLEAARLSEPSVDIDEIIKTIESNTININGHAVPKPESEYLENGEDYFIPYLHEETPYTQFSWQECLTCIGHLQTRLVHRTKEAAVLHGKALLSFTKIEEGK